MTARQKQTLIQLLHLFVDEGEVSFHHGDCIGADKQAFDMITELVEGVYTVAHPCTLEEQRAYTKSDRILPPKPPIARNHDIVDMVSLMIACPRTMKEEVRSGTWATIRYARDVYRPLIILDP